ncbi:MAG TPA: acyloxyacyl hydrolase [Terriglobales bacterium]|nr:acyloxyacyl hydrolase [Terriglobales bacterium]
MRLLLTGIVCLLCSIAALGQDVPQKGGHEIQVWAGGGHSVSGGTSNTGLFNAGLRYGWVLTGVHGPGFLKGNFEYAIDAIPLLLVFQPANTAYGVGLNPLGLKWNFVPHRSFAPYFEIGGGTLFTTHEVPAGSSNVNFTSGAALGIHHLGESKTWSLDVRYIHISNAGLTTPNPGINTVQVRLGLGVFRK